MKSKTSRAKAGRKFVHGLVLSEYFYCLVVASILEYKFPEIKYAAGLLGTGSEVIGFDDEVSTDHNWGLRLIIFLDEKDFAENKERIDRELRRSLPPSFLGYPTSFNEPDERGVRIQDLSSARD